MGCILLTGDRKLREAASKEGVTVHGTLYLVESLFMAKLATGAEIESAYARMQQAGSRLPWDEVQRQLSRLRSHD